MSINPTNEMFEKCRKCENSDVILDRGEISIWCDGKLIAQTFRNGKVKHIITQCQKS